VIAAVALSTQLLVHRIDRWMIDTHLSAPADSHLSLFERLFDQSPIEVTTTVEWRKVPVTATVDAVRSDPSLWRRMFFDDWDRVPDPLRTQGLERMWRHYREVVRAPSRWDRMTPRHWDLVPQPIRGMAFIEMVRYWSGFYQVGTAYGVPRGTVTNTMAAIMIVESAFEHRAITTNRAGNRDIGVAQASDDTRAALEELRAGGFIDFAPADEMGYTDPWQGSRVLVLWFSIMLDETGGDLDTAIRAYHRGGPLARAGEGGDYFDLVVDRRRRYLRDETASATWAFLRARVRDLPADPEPGYRPRRPP
jgi:hypothetical protein